MFLVLKNCGAADDKFIPLDMIKYEIYNVVNTDVPNVIGMDDDNLLSSICSAICSKNANSPSCVGFSSNVKTDHTCTLYSEVEIMNSSTISTPMNFTEELYIR